METSTVALFGEAEKGEFRTAYFCQTTAQLLERLGNPPPYSQGIYYAIQMLLYHHNLIFLRVREEGFSYQDYLLGVKLLQSQSKNNQLAAICVPGLGDTEIIEAISSLCAMTHSILITNESDFYDYLTEK